MKSNIEKSLIKLIKTASFEGADKRALANLIQKDLAQLPNVRLSTIETAGIVNVVASTGVGMVKVWSLCHADTIKALPGWKSDPLVPKKVGKKVIGLGASDMKGPLAVNIELFKWASQQHLPFSFSLCITQDEELGGRSGLPVLLNKLERPDFIMVNESTPDQKISLQEPGVVCVEINGKGKSLHCSRANPDCNVITLASQFICRCKNIFQGPGFIFNPTIIDGGTIQNVTPDHIKIVLDVRFSSPHTCDEVIQAIQKVNTLQSLNVLVKGEARKTVNDKFFATLKQTFQEQGIRNPITQKIMGSTDARFLSGTKINSAVFGNDCNHGNRHAPNEFVVLSELDRLFDIDKAFIKNLSKIV